MEITSEKVYKYGTLALITAIYLFSMLIYQEFIFSRYEYIGFGLNIKPSNVLISLFCFFFSVFLTLKLKVKPEVFATSIIIKLLILIPALVLFAMMNTDIRLIISVLLLDIGFLIFSMYKLNMHTPGLNSNNSVFLLLVLLVLCLGIIINTHGTEINLRLFYLSEIYKYRLMVRGNDTALSSYALFWSGRVLIPILFIIGFYRKNIFLLVVSTIALLLIFLIGGAHRSLLFSVFIILIFFLFKCYYQKVFIFTLSVLVLMISGLIILDIYHNDLLADLLIRRTLMDPSLMDIFYFDFFDGRPMELSHSIFRSLAHNPYEVQPSYIIGSEYLNNPLNNAGSGIIGDGFMNFGMPGVMISIFVAVFVLNFVLQANINHHFYGLVFIIIYGLTATGILTNLMNGGVIFLLIIIQFILKSYRNIQVVNV